MLETCHSIEGAPQFSGVEADALNVAPLGAVTVTLSGPVMTTGFVEQPGASTVRIEGLVSVDPASFVNTARTWSPDSEVFVGLIEKVSEFDSLAQELPWLVETCHSIDGGAQFSGVEADALKVAAAGAVTVTLSGPVTIPGFAEQTGELTIRVAGSLGVEPSPFVRRARYSFSDSEVFVGLIDNVCEVSPDTFPPETSFHEPPWSVETCHWIVAAEHSEGVAPSLTEKLAPLGAVTD